MALPVLKTVGDAVALLDEMKTSDALKEHAETLEGPRTRGSLTNVGLRDVNPDTAVYDVTSDIGKEAKLLGCTYYRFMSNEMAGRVESVKLHQVLDMGGEACIREGTHGPELYVDDAPPEDPVLQNIEIYIIVGKEGNEPAIFTWHPGAPLKPFDGVHLTRHTAVKTHNGE